METCIEKLQMVSDEIDKLFEAIIDEENEIEVVKDGIIDIPKYCNSMHKILWVLKEANQADGCGYDMRTGIAESIKTNPETRYTFLPIVYTSFGILHNCDWNLIPDLDEEDQSIADIIENVGFVNIKKVPGGRKTNPRELEEAFDSHGDIVLKQIKDYDPDIVILCYVSNLLAKPLGLTSNFEKTLGGITYWVKHTKLYIQVYHPNQRGSIQEYCTEIINIVREWEKNKKN
ncbi:MAG TPA: hypothetical protein VFE53_16090 [Mucilaginibacter sp.]|nr:hypothetical protein [Mucilaginibacter sp.]